MTLDASGKVRLWENRQEREEQEQQADLFSILKVTEKLERAWTRGLLSSGDYEKQCRMLIAQFKTLWDSLRVQVPDISDFMQRYTMQCPMAYQRLVVIGVPATVQHGGSTLPASAPSQTVSTGAQVSDTTAAFITCLDNVRLEMLAVDQLNPVLSDLLGALIRMPEVPPDFSGKLHVTNWLKKLNGMRADDELDRSEARQLEHDIQSSFAEWQQTLK